MVMGMMMVMGMVMMEMGMIMVMGMGLMIIMGMGLVMMMGVAFENLFSELTLQRWVEVLVGMRKAFCFWGCKRFTSIRFRSHPWISFLWLPQDPYTWWLNRNPLAHPLEARSSPSRCQRARLS